MDRIAIKPAYDINAFCAEFAVGRSKLYSEIKAGRLKVFKVGARTVIAGDEGLRWLNSYREGAVPPEPRGVRRTGKASPGEPPLAA